MTDLQTYADFFNERAAIIQHDGNASRATAEQRARVELKKHLSLSMPSEQAGVVSTRIYNENKG